MKLATFDDGTPDGALHVVTADGSRAISARTIAPTLQAALETWDEAAPALQALAAALEAGRAAGSMAVDRAPFRAPLPRAWQWLDASAFPFHGQLMQQAFGLPPVETDPPLMYQGMSHRFLGPEEDVPLPFAEDGIDFEGEFAVITGAVPMGITPAAAMDTIRLVTLVNDWSLRRIAPREMKTGFGWVQAKPACSAAPLAVTPAALGSAWAEGRVQRPLTVSFRGAIFGRAHGGAMAYGFHELIAHAARTRDLPAGTLIGSGTVSNEDAATVGSSCIAERRALEMTAQGEARTPFMAFGERVRMECFDEAGQSLFGAIDQAVIQNRGAA